MRSIQSRLGIGLTISLVAVFLLQWLVVSVTMRNLSEAGMTTHIEHDIDNLLAGLSFDATGGLRLAPDRVEQYYLQPFSGSYFRIVSGTQVIRSRSLWDQDMPAVTITAGQNEPRHLTGPQSQSLLMYTRAFELRGQRVVISVAKDLAPVEQDIRHFRNLYALVSAAALALLLVLQAILVNQGLRPLRRTHTELKQLEQGEISALGEEVPAELRPLVRELNHLLAAMKQRLVRSRQALGNLAHALKAPLTLLMHQTAQAKPGASVEWQQSMATQLQTMHQLIERELKRARLSGSALPGLRFDLAAELAPLVEALRSIYRERSLAIETRLPGTVTLAADREDMLELLGNLLDNACKWAKSRVLIEVIPAPETKDATLIINIHDDGPGCPAESLADLAQRGARLDETVPGHGLGLAIATDIAADYGGGITFGRSEILGGFLVIVHLALGQRTSAGS